MVVTHDHALAETVEPARARRIAAFCDIGPIDGDVRREIRRIRADQAARVAAGLDDSQLATIVLLVRRHLDELVSFDPAVREAAIAERRLRTGDAGHRFRTRLWGRVLGFASAVIDRPHAPGMPTHPAVDDGAERVWSPRPLPHRTGRLLRRAKREAHEQCRGRLIGR
ncbi:hypothetical protein BH24ACT5_BH24ACT5_09720 [soil metagenome]